MSRKRLSMTLGGHKWLSWQMASLSDFFEIFATEPNVAAGVPFARYMELAMYHPTAGYYTRDFKRVGRDEKADFFTATTRSEEHTSELQSPDHLVCRLLLEKKKQRHKKHTTRHR